MHVPQSQMPVPIRKRGSEEFLLSPADPHWCARYVRGHGERIPEYSVLLTGPASTGERKEERQRSTRVPGLGNCEVAGGARLWSKDAGSTEGERKRTAVSLEDA